MADLGHETSVACMAQNMCSTPLGEQRVERASLRDRRQTVVDALLPAGARIRETSPLPALADEV